MSGVKIGNLVKAATAPRLRDCNQDCTPNSPVCSFLTGQFFESWDPKHVGCALRLGPRIFSFNGQQSKPHKSAVTENTHHICAQTQTISCSNRGKISTTFSQRGWIKL